MATALFTLGSFGAGKERQAAPSRETIWRKIDFQTRLPQEKQGTSKKGPRGHCLVGEGAAQISSLSFSSTLTFCIKVVTSGREFLGFCVMSLRLRRRGREKEGSKSRGGWKREGASRLISPFTSGVLAETATRRGRARPISVEEIVMQSKLFHSIHISILILLYMKFTYH